MLSAIRPPRFVPSQTRRLKAGKLAAVPKKQSPVQEAATAKAATIRSHMLSGKTVVAQIAPAVGAAIGEPFGLPAGSVHVEQVVTLLKALGFRYCFDVRVAADLTVVEEVHEFVRRLTAGELDHRPMFTSCCPGWTQLAAKQFPDIVPYISTCKSPQMMEAAIVKQYFAKRVLLVNPDDVFLVSIMPCVKKQSESDAPENFSAHSATSDVDMVVTTAELGAIFQYNCLSPEHQLRTPFDDPMSGASGSSAIFARTGGVMTAVIRYAVAALAGKNTAPSAEFHPMDELPGVLEADVNICVARNAMGIPEGTTIQLKVAVVVGLGDAKKYVKALSDGSIAGRHQLVEVMACAPAGCVSGGGQPNVGKNKAVLLQRKDAVDQTDASALQKSAIDNEQVQDLYNDFLGHPGSGAAHDILHRRF